MKTYTTQEVRRKLNQAKYVPIAKINQCEIWVKFGRRINLLWEGEHPEKAPVCELQYARIVRGRIVPQDEI